MTRLFVDEKFLTTVVPVATELGINLNHIYIIKGNSSGRKSFWSIIRDVRTRKIPRVDVRTANKDTLAYLVFSSGTSGLPKGNYLYFFLFGFNSSDTITAVMVSHGNILFALGQMSVAKEVAGPAVTVHSLCTTLLDTTNLHNRY